MARTASGKQRVDRIINKQKNGDRYVYERISEYDKEKRYYKSVSTKLLGIMKPGSDDRYDLLPTRPKAQPKQHGITSLFNSSSSTFSARTGMIDIVRHISEKSGVHTLTF